MMNFQIDYNNCNEKSLYIHQNNTEIKSLLLTNQNIMQHLKPELALTGTTSSCHFILFC